MKLLLGHTHTNTQCIFSLTRVGVLRSLAGDPWHSSEGADPISPRDGFPKRLAELLTLQLLVDLNVDRLCYSTRGQASESHTFAQHNLCIRNSQTQTPRSWSCRPCWCPRLWRSRWSPAPCTPAGRGSPLWTAPAARSRSQSRCYQCLSTQRSTHTHTHTDPVSQFAWQISI